MIPLHIVIINCKMNADNISLYMKGAAAAAVDSRYDDNMARSAGG
jgi:hypothetical protein